MYKVFLVDDEPQIIHGLCTQIEWDSYNMEIVGASTNALDALNILANNKIHLLFTDVRMPYLDGLTLICKAKQTNPSLRCIMISAYNDFNYVKQALQLGVENYLLKPINESELQDTLTKTLENLDRDEWINSVDSPDILAFRTNLLDRWVRSSIEDFELYERADLLNIDLSSPEYLVCVFHVIHTGKFKNRFACSSFLLELCRTSFAQTFRAECFLDSNFCVVIILRGEYLQEKTAELESCLKRISIEAGANEFQFFASVGFISPTYLKVSDSYKSALLFLNYRFINPSVDFFFSTNSTDLHYRTFNVDLENNLLKFDKAILEGDMKQAQFIVDTLTKQPNVPIEVCKQRLLPFIMHLIQTMDESGKKTESLPYDVLNKLSDFTNIESNEGFISWLNKIMCISIEVVHNRKGSFHPLIQRALNEINQNYQTELSLKSLSDKFKASSAYLGKLFKEETGKYFNDYLTQVRLESSKSLLVETKMKISEIVQLVGIPNQSYFNRVFRKMYGLSPLEFRRKSLH